MTPLSIPAVTPKQIAGLRARLDVSQTEMAEMLGMTRDFIARAERGESTLGARHTLMFEALSLHVATRYADSRFLLPSARKLAHKAKTLLEQEDLIG